MARPRVGNPTKRSLIAHSQRQLFRQRDPRQPVHLKIHCEKRYRKVPRTTIAYDAQMIEAVNRHGCLERIQQSNGDARILSTLGINED